MEFKLMAMEAFCCFMQVIVLPVYNITEHTSYMFDEVSNASNKFVLPKFTN